MINFECDYTEGAYPKILEKMMGTNMEQTVGYGVDPYCEEAKRLIQKECGGEDVTVHFLVGGTQTNTTVIAALLRPHQGVISADAGHIACHEAGAIEATGHKVITLESREGKIVADQIKGYYEAHYADGSREHIVQPAMVYISNPTEYGTLYTKQELEELSAICKKLGLLFYLDGARLGYGLTAEGYDVTIADLAKLTDVFYIGGTKQGALFGEAVVFAQPSHARDFRYLIKQKGGMLAKGRLLGIQFQVLFEDGAYYTLARHGNEMAMKLKDAFIQKGYTLHMDTITNQQFVVLDEQQLERLSKKYLFSLWEALGNGKTVVRFCTSWATKEEHVNQLINDL
ncbi:MAG: low specificity L-threonine aldolase [Eubacteriales bacterium]